MRLITHNLLACHARTCTQTSNNFPLRFEQITKLELIEADFNEAFVRGFLPKVDWDALVSAARSLGSDVGEGLPKSAPDLDDPMLDQELLKKVHHVLLEMHIVEGQMLCPNCSHVFQIRNGIPNMLLAEHELAR
ncbi:Trm112p-domain-containing protein [Acaromyces ingoldii]|uniref:Trm112p-domain-containing protein n=1 Tax=Acaromyces ingoldii TaxID=215250 RepID=A0A316YR47_9BASI|nr:Trm112p-domain-containing protein [Acaromyces ingoldii]PWN90235.1 Trm112p-domain-containing protein [Acaromyces ingoldii]